MSSLSGASVHRSLSSFRQESDLTADDVPAHDQKITHNYTVHYPDHSARADDPHYIDFNHIHDQWKADPQKWQCAVAVRYGTTEYCDNTNPFELHHAHIEQALINSVDLSLLENDYPGISDPATVGAWAESAANLVVLCVFHHRGHGGAHTASHSDWEGEQYIKGLIV